jgi:hypothetical protein
MVDEEISPKCKIRLETPPNCGDARELRSYALCHAQWIGIRQKGQTFSEALKEGWKAARQACAVS